MPRRSSGARSGPARAPVRNPPRPAAPAPPPAAARSGSGSALGGIGSTIAEGMAFGTGSAVAHRAVDALMGPRVIQHETVASSAPPAVGASPTVNANSVGGSDACGAQFKGLQDCLSGYGNDDISKCQFYMDMLTECRRGSGSVLSA